MGFGGGDVIFNFTCQNNSGKYNFEEKVGNILLVGKIQVIKNVSKGCLLLLWQLLLPCQSLIPSLMN
jgi:hypothetical protein